MAQKNRVEVRIDVDTHTRLKELASESDVSLNQIVNGVLRWAARYGHAGAPEYSRGDIAQNREEEHRLWFGEPTGPRFGPDGDEYFVDGHIVFELDFSDRNAMRPWRAPLE